MATELRFECTHFDALGVHALYALVALRSRVFVVEQTCVFLDADGLDIAAHHVLGWAGDGDLASVARILSPGVVYDEPSIGRVVSAPEHRGTGTGRRLMQRAIAECLRMYGDTGIRIGAQRYLERFYGSLGFVTVSDPYDEDGIPHVTMLRPA